MWELARHDRSALRHGVEPIFIIGHWQSGHSPFQFLMAQDPRLGFVSTLHCALPAAFLTVGPFIRRFLKRRLPESRIADSLPLDIDSPQGDDMGLASLSPLSFYHAYVFPQQAERIFRRAVLLEDVSMRQMRRWQRTYRRFLGKVAMATGCRQIIARNASNTGRIPQLLEAFPNAKFIHVYRNPYHVFVGTNERMVRLLDLWSLQRWEPADIREQTLSFYERLMRRYFETRELIPRDRLVEIRYEDFAERPLEIMEQAYQALNLGSFQEVRPAAQAYISENNHLPAGNQLPKSGDTSEIARRWGFAIDQLGYDRL